MKNLNLLNFLVILNLINVTSKIKTFDDLRAPSGARPAGGTGHSDFAGTNITGANSSPDTYVVNFGTHDQADSASTGSAKDGDDISPRRRTPSPIARNLVDATGAVRGLSAELANLMEFNRATDPERKPVIGAGSVGGVIWPRVTRSGLVRPGAAGRTRSGRGGASAGAAVLSKSPTTLPATDALGKLATICETRVRSRSDSSPRVLADPLSSAVLRIAGTLEQSTGYLAAQARDHAVEVAELKAQRATEVRERADERAAADAYARRPWYRRAEARAECINFTTVVFSAAAGATAIAALYYQNNPY